MKEIEYLNIIQNTLSDSSYLGDDCALLDEFGLYVTQDTLVENVHFILATTSPCELAQKAVNVNLSDLASNAALPLYITVSLSFPNKLGADFVNEFYKGIDICCEKFNIKVVGGDLTSSDRLVISICAIGKKCSDINISRSCAQVGDIVVTTGFHGDSAGGLNLLLAGKTTPEYLIKKHLCPLPQIEKSKVILNAASSVGVSRFAMMDTSDGLGDAVYKISKSSNVTLRIDTILVSDTLKATFSDEWKDLALWGGEDFELLFCVPQQVYDLLDKTQFYKIGVVTNESLSLKSIE